MLKKKVISRRSRGADVLDLRTCDQPDELAGDAASVSEECVAAVFGSQDVTDAHHARPRAAATSYGL